MIFKLFVYLAKIRDSDGYDFFSGSQSKHLVKRDMLYKTNKGFKNTDSETSVIILPSFEKRLIWLEEAVAIENSLVDCA